MDAGRNKNTHAVGTVGKFWAVAGVVDVDARELEDPDVEDAPVSVGVASAVSVADPEAVTALWRRKTRSSIPTFSIPP